MVMPVGISNIYTASSEHRRTITIVKTICAASSIIPPILIIPAKLHMESWIHDSLQKDIRLFVSETGYTNDDLGVRYLRQFITHLKAGSDQPKKFLLLDGYYNHKELEFRELAKQNNIKLFYFPSYLTHVL